MARNERFRWRRDNRRETGSGRSSPRGTVAEKLPGETLGPDGRLWLSLAAIATLELIVCVLAPTHVLTDLPLLGTGVALLARIAPMITNFNGVAVFPQAVSFSLAFCTLLIFPKAWVFYRWLNSDYRGTYRHLVISPLTYERPSRGDEFLGIEPKGAAEIPGERRSVFARFFGSLVVLLFILILLVVWLNWGWNVERGGSGLERINASHRSIAEGGLSLWFGVNLKTVPLALLLAVGGCIVRDYVRYLSGRLEARE